MPMLRSNCLSGCDFAPQVKVVRGGKLKARKGVNVPDVEIDCAALTAKVCLAGWVFSPSQMWLDGTSWVLLPKYPDISWCCPIQLPGHWGCGVPPPIGPTHWVHLRVVRAEGSGFAGHKDRFRFSLFKQGLGREWRDDWTGGHQLTSWPLGPGGLHEDPRNYCKETTFGCCLVHYVFLWKSGTLI